MEQYAYMTLESSKINDAILLGKKICIKDHESSCSSVVSDTSHLVSINYWVKIRRGNNIKYMKPKLSLFRKK